MFNSKLLEEKKYKLNFIAIGSLRKCQICKEFKPLDKYKSIDYDKTGNENLWGDDKSKIIYAIKPHHDLCNDCVADIHQGVMDEENERSRKDSETLDEVYSTLSDNQIEFIKSEIQESGGGYNFQIQEYKPNLDIEYEKEDNDSFNTYVEQWSNYPCEDCYSGNIYIELIPNKKYLKWSFSM